MKNFYLALDLKNEQHLIEEYEAYHKNVWPEIIEKIKESGIVNCEIFRVQNRLVMRLEAHDDFSFEKKEILDASSEMVNKWEDLMWTYQQALPGSKVGEKWQLMTKIFDINN
jgi:L-rhamnose mutarotase